MPAGVDGVVVVLAVFYLLVFILLSLLSLVVVRAIIATRIKRTTFCLLIHARVILLPLFSLLYLLFCVVVAVILGLVHAVAVVLRVAVRHTIFRFRSVD